MSGNGVKCDLAKARPLGMVAATMASYIILRAFAVC